MRNPRLVTALLLFISGMGGFLYGYDIGVIGAALLYLGKSITLSLVEESLIVAAVLGGGMLSSLLAGVLADAIGRRRVMLLAGVLFLASVWLIVIAQGFLALFLGRTLQGLSAGMIAVVIPLYLAECLPAHIRGRGTAIFQLLITIGILVALAVGSHLTGQVDALARLPGTTPEILRAGQDAAWRDMFLSALYPGVLFFAGAVLMAESPRWLLRHGREAEAWQVLQRSRPDGLAKAEFDAMRAAVAGEKPDPSRPRTEGSLLQRKYVVPLLLTFAVMGLNQATGINSILQFLVVILQDAGLVAVEAAQQATWITAVNVAFTVIGFFLVDRLGRKGLLLLGTGGITLALVVSAVVFQRAQAGRIDVTATVSRQLAGRQLVVPLKSLTVGLGEGRHQLTVLYSVGGQSKLVSAFDDSPNAVLSVDAAELDRGGAAPLQVEKATFGPVPTRASGWLVTGCFMVFIASFAIGPGICGWLILSELLPTRIRSLGMGVGLLINQGVSTGIAAIFLPFVGHHGYPRIFEIWAALTAAYFLIVLFLLPETKGRSLEEIERSFTPKSRARV